MTTQSVTIELPEPIFRQLVRIAEVTQQPIEAIVTQSVMSNLPPSVDDLPLELQPELLEMQNLDVKALLDIAQAQVESGQYSRHTDLLEKKAAELLTLEEKQELLALRQAADQRMLRKTYAWSLLRWRGQRVPALQEIPVPQ